MTIRSMPAVQRPPLFERLEAGLNEALAHVQGKAQLRTHTLPLPAPPPVYSAEQVRHLRVRLGMSQPHFSRLLNVSPRTLQNWERGTRVPRQSAARLLQIIENPDTLASLRQAS
jgi:putative transcriptional regulator